MVAAPALDFSTSYTPLRSSRVYRQDAEPQAERERQGLAGAERQIAPMLIALSVSSSRARACSPSEG
jgi:hypothetical protein